MNKGERAITIDEVPLEWCFQPGVKLDFRNMEDGHVITAKEVEDELLRIGHELKPLEIVVVNTRAGARYGNDDYVNRRLRHGLRRHHVPAREGHSPDRHRRLELGRAVLFHRPEMGETTIRRSSGRATRPAATSATATSRSCTISRRCPATASPSPASRTRSAAPRPAGRAPWRSSRNSTASSRATPPKGRRSRGTYSWSARQRNRSLHCASLRLRSGQALRPAPVGVTGV